MDVGETVRFFDWPAPNHLEVFGTGGASNDVTLEMGEILFVQ